MGREREGIRESNGGVERTKVKYIRVESTPLNIDLGSKNERQDWKLGAVEGRHL
jgi:hypothetical protein